MSVLRREGYVAKIEFDGRDQVFVGRVLGIDDVVGFHGHSVQLLHLSFGIALKDYRAMCKTFGRKPQRTHSGKFMVRMEPRLQARALMAAEARGMSLNAWMEEAVRRVARIDLGEV